MNREQSPPGGGSISKPIRTGHADLDEVLAELDPDEALEVAKTLERYIAAIRAALVTAGHDPAIGTAFTARNTHLPVLDYAFPVPPESAASTIQSRPGGKKGWMKVHLCEREIDELRAFAACLGRYWQLVVPWAIQDWKRKIEEKLGIRAQDAVKLTAGQRASIGRKFWAVSEAAGYPLVKDRN